METGKVFQEDRGNDLLVQVQEGMDVIDSQGEMIGTVERVQMGNYDPTGRGSATDEGQEVPRSSFLRDLARAFTPGDDLAEEVRQDLLYRGFIRLDTAKLLARDRYISPDAIDRIDNSGVHLKVPFDQLSRQE